MIRILIVDDHAIVRQGLRMLLDAKAHIEIVGEAADGESAVQMAEILRPDVILIDLLMPGVSGVEAIERIRTSGIKTGILALTSSLEEQLVKRALQAGAQGYILKASRASDLIQAIEDIAQGKSSLDPAAAQVLMKQVTQPDPVAELTGRERDVFDALARGKTNTEIAASLDITEATVRTHIASILDKLELRDRMQVMIYALKRGLIHIDDLP
jgi:NarL family two-component system response regulator LiaR